MQLKGLGVAHTHQDITFLGQKWKSSLNQELKETQAKIWALYLNVMPNE